MARFIVLRVEDNDEAAQIVETIKTNDRWDGGGFSSVSVRGLFAIPTKFCECDTSDPAKPRRITRGGRLGWWVDRNCSKPVRGSWQSPHNLLDGPEVHNARPVGDPNWKDPEFMFQPKLTGTHALGSASETGEVAQTTNDATTRSE